MNRNRILVALDKSDMAPLVLERAIELARATDATLRLVCIVPETVKPPVANIFSPGGDVNALMADAESELLAHQARIPEKHRGSVVVAVGSVPEAICKYARSYNADVVVIGAHRYGLLDRMLGTTAAKIVNHVDRPVLVVRPVAAPPPIETGDVVDTGKGRAQAHSRSFVANHPMLETATFAGAVSGAAVGALGGPPGAIVGGIIGTAIGAIAGGTLDREDRRASQHDHELDDVIGVTKGDLGAGMQRQEQLGAAATAGRMSSSAKMLQVEHHRLEAIYDGLLSAYRSGSWEDVRTQWAQFEPALRAHMDMEEERVFPAFRAAAPTEADGLAAEHVEMRKLLDTLAIAIELHAMPQRDAEELVMRLRRHGEREERILYPWLEEQPLAHPGDALGRLSAA